MRLNPTQPGKSLKIDPKVLDFWLLQFAEAMWKSTSTFWWNEWALPKKRRQRGMDSQVGETHTVYLLLMKHWSINSRYPLAKERIQLKSSFPQSYMCVFSNRIYSIVKYRNRSIVFWFVIVFRKWGLHLLKSPENHLFEKQDHLPSTSARVYPRKIPPWTKRNRQILVRTKLGAPTCWSNLRHKPHGCDAMYGVYMDAWKVRSRWINSIHECLGDRWHRKIGVSWF